jgi:hypothetical protein
VTVRLTPGKWEYECEPHKRTMHGDFVVGGAAAAGTTTDDDEDGGRRGGSD